MLRRPFALFFVLLLNAVWLIALPAAAQPRATLTLADVALPVGESDTLEARIDCGDVRCTAFQISAAFDPRVVQVDEVALGGYLGDQALVAEYKVDNEAGMFEFAAAALGNLPDAHDDLLFTITLTGIAAGSTEISVTAFEIGDLTPLIATLRGGSIEVTTSRATATPTPTPTRTPTPSPTATEVIACPGAVPPRLIVGEWAVVTPGTPNNLRDTPSSDGTRVGQIPGGRRFQVIEGPVCADGYTWWRVDYSGRVGWTAEGDHETYWLAPLGMSANDETINTTSQAAYQRYDHGTMVWLGLFDKVYVLFDDHTYVEFDDLEADQARAPEMSMSPPAGRFAPVRGFSIIWRLYPYVRNGVGWGLHHEVGYSAQVEYTSGGGTLYFTGPEAQNYLLREDGTWLGG